LREISGDDEIELMEELRFWREMEGKVKLRLRRTFVKLSIYLYPINS
jgi:hypothetical protein